MDYPKNQSEEAQPPIEEKPWWEQEPDTEASREQLFEQIKKMQQAQQGIPKGLVLKQGVAIGFIIVNLWFLYINISTPVAGYIAAYMLPISILLLDYFLVVAELKKIARGEKK